MNPLFKQILKKAHDLSSIPLMALSLCCVVLCSMMYVQMVETGRMYTQLASQLESLNMMGPLSLSEPATVSIDEPEVPLADALQDVKVQVGDTITVKVMANQVTDLYGYQFKLNFDESVLEYKSLRTSIPEISAIFQKPFDGYILVGATQVGDNPGVSASNTPVCEIVLRMKKDGVSPDLSISEVSVVNSALDYVQDIPGWHYELAGT